MAIKILHLNNELLAQYCYMKKTMLYYFSIKKITSKKKGKKKESRNNSWKKNLIDNN